MPLKQVYCGGSLARRCSMPQNTRAVAAGLLQRVFGPPLYMRSSAKISYGKTLHLWCLFIWSFSSFNFLWSIWIKIQIEIGLNRIGPQSWVFIIFVSLFGHWERREINCFVYFCFFCLVMNWVHRCFIYDFVRIGILNSNIHSPTLYRSIRRIRNELNSLSGQPRSFR